MSNGRQRRSSIVVGVLLVALGVVFLAEHLNPALGIGHLIRLWWPVLLILWGVAKAVDYMTAPRDGQARGPFVSGGEAALLVLLVLILGGFVFRDWILDHYRDLGDRMTPFYHSYSQSHTLTPATIPAGARVVIETEWGDINVHGGASNELVAGITETAWGANESAAQERMRNVDVTVEKEGDGYSVRTTRQLGFRSGVRASIDVQVPKTSNVTSHTGGGDIRAAGISGKLEVRTQGGNIEVQDAGSDVTATVQQGDTRIERVAGSVQLSGLGQHAEIADIGGDLSVEGFFTASGSSRHVKGTTHLVAPRWMDITIGQLNGSIEIPDATNIRISDAGGPVRISTHNKDIELNNIAGRLDVTDIRGDVKVHYTTAPREDVSIANDAGDIELALPGDSRFVVSAVSRSGDVQSDFSSPSLQTTGEERSGRLIGEFGAKSGMRAPTITLATSYGSIRLRKSK